jgi:hypothetical protein
MLRLAEVTLQTNSANNGEIRLWRIISWEVLVTPYRLILQPMLYCLEMRYRVFDKSKFEKLDLYHTPTPKITKAYILGALHDSTERKYTYRISQKYHSYVKFIVKGIKSLGFNAWVYREGKERSVFVVEFAKRFLANVEVNTLKHKADYVRGYFDADGSVPRSLTSRYYIYFAQKNLEDLTAVRNYLLDLGINCGKIHNPSKRVDPHYFRFYVLKDSFNSFYRLVGSWHPVKGKYLRMKI